MKSLRLFLFSVSAILLTGYVSANELVIFCADNQPPKCFYRDGKPSGFIVEMTEYAMKEAGQDYRINLHPWPRSYAHAINGDGGIIALSMNSKRLTIFDYSDVLYSADTMVIVKKGNEFSFNDITDLKGKRIGVLRHSSMGDKYDQAVKDKLFTVVEYAGSITAMKMLLQEQIDVTFYGSGKYGIENLINSDPELKQQRESFVILDKPFLSDPNYLGIPKSLKMKPLLKRFNLAIKKGYETGDFDKIIKRNMSKN